MKDKKELSGIQKKIRTAKRVAKISQKGAKAINVLLTAGVKLAPVLSEVKKRKKKS